MCTVGHTGGDSDPVKPSAYFPLMIMKVSLHFTSEEEGPPEPGLQAHPFSPTALIPAARALQPRDHPQEVPTRSTAWLSQVNMPLPTPLAASQPPRQKGGRNITGFCWAFLGPGRESLRPGSWGDEVGLGLGPLRGGSGSCGLARSSGFLVGHRAGCPLPCTGPSPAAPHRHRLGQMLAEVGWHGHPGLGSKAGVVPALDAIPTRDGALPGKRGRSWD